MSVLGLSRLGVATLRAISEEGAGCWRGSGGQPGPRLQDFPWLLAAPTGLQYLFRRGAWRGPLAAACVLQRGVSLCVCVVSPCVALVCISMCMYLYVYICVSECVCVWFVYVCSVGVRAYVSLRVFFS